MDASTARRADHPTADVARSIKDEILGIVRSARLSPAVEDAVLSALSGPTRVLPEGKSTRCAALTVRSCWSAAGAESAQAVPAAAAMEMLMAAGDVIDDIQDDEAALPRDRRSLGQVLETVALLLMLCHSAIQRVAERGAPAHRAMAAPPPPRLSWRRRAERTGPGYGVGKPFQYTRR